MAKQSPRSAKEAFFAAVPKLKVSTVELEGQAVTVKEMNVGQRIAFEEAAKGKTSNEVALLIVAASVVDDDGNPMFSPEDVDRLKAVSPDYLLPVVHAAFKVNALTDQDVGELAKNS